MNHRKRSIATVALIVLLCLVVAACGSNNAPAGNQPGNGNGSNANENATGSGGNAGGGSAGGKTKVNFIMQFPAPQNFLAKFHEAHPEVEVNWEMVDTANISQMIKTRIAAGGENLDIVVSQKADYPQFVNSGAFEDLSDLSFLGTYDPDALDSARIDGKLYGIPLSQSAYAIWFNKDIFDEYGLVEPTNWEEFLDVSAKLKAEGVPPLVVGAKEPWLATVLSGIGYGDVLGNDPQWLTKAAKGEVKWTDPQSVSALQKTKLLVDEGYLMDGVLGLGADQAYQAFYQQRAAMIVSGIWLIDLVSSNTPEFAYGAFVPPGNENGTVRRQAFTPGGTMSVAASSKNKDAIMTLLEYMSVPENAEFFSNDLRVFPNIKSASVNFHPATEVVEHTLNSEKSEMMHAHLSLTVNSMFGNTIQKLLTGESTPEQVAAEIQAAQDKDIP